MSGILGLISGAISPITNLIDNLHTSDDEKLEAKTELLQIQSALTVQMLEYEKAITQEQGSTIRAEATGHSWAQRNWRPVIMLLFGYIIAHNYVIAPVFGVPYSDIPPDMWMLLKIGMGGYVAGRTVEKVVPAAMEAMKAREET